MKQTILLLFLTTSFSFGQNSYDVPIGMPTAFLNNDTSKRVITYKIKGSPYLMDEYENGSTTIFNKKGFDASMRYNAAKDVIEFIDDDRKVKEVLRRPYITASFNGKTYEVLAYMEGEKEKLAYFNRLNSGETQLLFKPKKQIKIDAQIFQSKRVAHYKDASAYYLSKKGKPAEEIRLIKVKVLEKLKDKTEEMEKFIADYSLNLKRESDVVRLLDYYNSLKSPKPKVKMARS